MIQLLTRSVTWGQEDEWRAPKARPLCKFHATLFDKQQTPLCIYAKPDKTVCTQACCQTEVMLEWWHPCDRSEATGPNVTWRKIKKKKIIPYNFLQHYRPVISWKMRSFCLPQKLEFVRICTITFYPCYAANSSISTLDFLYILSHFLL